MADLTFNTTAGQTVDRALLILYLNTGESGTPVWSPIGKRVEDSSAEYDWGKETKTDIFGEVYKSRRRRSPSNPASWTPETRRSRKSGTSASRNRTRRRLLLFRGLRRRPARSCAPCGK